MNLPAWIWGLDWDSILYIHIICKLVRMISPIGILRAHSTQVRPQSNKIWSINMKDLQFLCQKSLWKPISSPHPTVFILVQNFLITPQTITRASKWSQPWIFVLLQVFLHSAAQIMFWELDFIAFLFYGKLLVDFSRLANKVHIPSVACETIRYLVPTNVSSPVSLHLLSLLQSPPQPCHSKLSAI